MCVCRWKIGGNGLIVQEQDKNVLEFVAVKNPQSLMWAMPGVSLSFRYIPFHLKGQL